MQVTRSQTEANVYHVPKQNYQSPAEYEVESDASSATYPLAMAAITGTTCTVPNIGSASLQGDARFAVDVLKPMGCAVKQTETSTTVTGPPIGELIPLPEVDMEPMTDAFLTACVLAAVAKPNEKGATTRITGIANQRQKECNRIKAMYDERFCRMFEFYLISAETMFTTGSQQVFHMQLAKKRDAAPIVRDYITDLQRRYREIEPERLKVLEGLRGLEPSAA